MAQRIVSASVKETESMGRKLGRLLKAGDIIALVGELGSGKTTFTKGIARGLGIAHSEYVNSPSFVLIKEYKGDINLYHFDLYRLDNLYEMEYIGIEEYLNRNGALVIEWAQKLKGLLPAEHLKIDIDIIDENRRGFMLQPHGKRYDTIISRYIKR